jgi:hypothetical protein
MLTVTVSPSDATGEIPEGEVLKFIEVMKTERYTAYLSGVIGRVSSSSTQRKAMAEILKSRNVSTAVVTDQAIVRGIVTAIGWLGANMRAFSWTETTAALEYLTVPAIQRDRVLDRLAQMRKEAESTLS